MPMTLAIRRRPVILGPDARPYRAPVSRAGLEAKYDAAQTTDENRRHWANADLLSANAAASADVRKILRSRARYEVANNCYAKGIVRTLASDVIGTGPRLQLLTDDSATNQRLERAFMTWARGIRLAEKLRVMRMAVTQDGEAFALFTTNWRLSTPIRLDLRLVEADLVTTPWNELAAISDEGLVDGVRLDTEGNPVSYTLLKRHPGDGGWTSRLGEYEEVQAEKIIYWFIAERPGQARGVPELTPALPLFAMLRRYTLAVLGAAEAAADWALVFKTNQPPDGSAAGVEPNVIFELERQMGVFAPEGWEPVQIRAEQPATTYPDFKREILNEIARCLDIPYNIAACNSSGYNYASGRLDHQTYFKSIEVQRDHIECVALDRILAEWLDEGTLVPGLLPAKLTESRELPPHQWFWDGREHVDPAKEARAQAERLANHATTLAGEYAKQGLDWEAELRQRGREVALMRELDLPLPSKGGDTARPEGDGEE